MWIKRTFEQYLSPPSKPLGLFAVWLLLGPRQVGKSSLFWHLQAEGRQYINLDDLETRTRANADPILFAKEIKPPCFIDEIEYAPGLLSAIKVIADRTTTPGAVWLSGSQNFEVMKGIEESLAGRVAILNLFGLSDEEAQPSPDPIAYFQHIWRSTFPKLHGIDDAAAVELYLSSYVRTYIERDVRELLGIQKRREFEIFLRLAALRTGQLVNFDSLSRDVGVSSVTIKEWLGLLEDSFILKLLQPHHSNHSKRLIKAPKLYFLDAGLAAYLAGWKDSELLRLCPLAGSILETHVFGNLYRHFTHHARDARINFFRTKDGDEIDFLVDTGKRVIPVEVKMGTPKAGELPKLSKFREERWANDGYVISLASTVGKRTKLNDEWKVVHPAEVGEVL